MKRIYTTLITALYSLGAMLTLSAQSYNRNLVLEQIYFTPDSTSGQYVTGITYLDGLGYPEMKVTHAGTGSLKDITVLTEYDGWGREDKTWLSVPTGTDGSYTAKDAVKTGAQSFYGAVPYHATGYDSSPLSRPLTHYVPGTAWQTHPARQQYLTNDQTTLLKASYYKLSGDTITQSGYYATGELFVNCNINEDNHKSYVFTDKQGKTVLTRQTEGTDNLDTYYIYDEFGNLRVVLPPMFQDEKILSHYAFIYKYDNRNRIIEKKLPGAGAITYKYDKADRMVFRQDAEQKKRNEWCFVFYDILGREVIQGICTAATVPDVSDKVIQTSYSTASGILNSGYAVPSGISGLVYNQLTVARYYDTYNFLDHPSHSAHKTKLAYALDNGATSSTYGTKYESTISGLASKGWLTGEKSGLLGGSGGTKMTACYYDHSGRIIQSRSTNHLGGYDMKYVQYNLQGEAERELFAHYASATATTATIQMYTYTYDGFGRLHSTRYKLGANAEVTLSTNEYDEIGRLKRRLLHNSATLSTTYGYNIRGWLNSIKATPFEQQLYYTDGPGSPCYSGNVSSMVWKSGTETTTRGYKYTYDNVGRMKQAIYGEGSSLTTNAGRFSESIGRYDKNGNIKTLTRYGKLTASAYGLTDNLTFAHTGNRLKYVNDTATDPTLAGSFNFKDGSKSTGQEYLYDSNGNLTKDLNKNISSITYNYLYLPERISFSDGSHIGYVYSADGTRLRTIHTPSSGPAVTTDYCGGIIYKGGTIEMIRNHEGYITLSGTIPTYYYYLRDHQGNNRVVVNSAGSVVQANHYYPFGGIFADGAASSNQPFKYNDKEFDRSYGLDLYDYSARQMDPALGQFTTMDPLAEKYYSVSPYAYCLNNPVNAIDPDGREIDWFIKDKTGDLYFDRNRTEQSFSLEGEDYSRIGGNDLFDNYAEGSHQMSINYEDAKGLVSNHGYSIEASQQLFSINSSTSSYSTGKNNVTIDNGFDIYINEKYTLAPKYHTRSTTHSKMLAHDAVPTWYEFAAGTKVAREVWREGYNYTPISKGQRTLINILKGTYTFMSNLQGNIEQKNIKVYHTWDDYYKATKGEGMLLDYK